LTAFSSAAMVRMIQHHQYTTTITRQFISHNLFTCLTDAPTGVNMLAPTTLAALLALWKSCQTFPSRALVRLRQVRPCVLTTLTLAYCNCSWR
jgi:hypothetical protein